MSASLRACLPLALPALLVGCPELDEAVDALGAQECPTSSEAEPEDPFGNPQRVPWCHGGDLHDSVTITWDAGELAAMSVLYGTDTWAVPDANIAHGTADSFCMDQYTLTALQADGEMVVSTSPGSASYGDAQSNLGPLSLPSGYSLSSGLEFSCTMCGYYPIVELKEDPVVVKPAGIAHGMTWVHKGVDPVTGVVTVGCDNGVGCDPVDGDTLCTEARPLLCMLDLAMPQPASVPSTSTYFTWSGGVVATTPPVSPELDGLATIADADALCAAEFGVDWRTAEFHDGWGWNFLAYGNVGDPPRFWVDIDDQPNGTCWSH